MSFEFGPAQHSSAHSSRHTFLVRIRQYRPARTIEAQQTSIVARQCYRKGSRPVAPRLRGVERVRGNVELLRRHIVMLRDIRQPSIAGRRVGER